MWRATVLTLFPGMFPGSARRQPRRPGAGGGAVVARRAATSGRTLTDRHRSVDDTPAGGGPGMVMRADVLARAIDAAAPDGDTRPRLLMSPRGLPARPTRGSRHWRGAVVP